jgi:hypothetical protein
MSDREVQRAGDADDFDLLAASLRADVGDLHTLAPVLGAKLAEALPGRVALHRGGFFGNGPLDGFAVDLGEWRFGLHMAHGQPVAERIHTVRGIALKTEAMPLEGWIDALSAALAELAAASAHDRAALLRLLS